jgi:hypothetical protein
LPYPGNLFSLRYKITLFLGYSGNTRMRVLAILASPKMLGLRHRNWR